ncbi:hypothetical protein Agabi119p4_6148 [Agaricus bisporus var. burnettii]|uniref:DUF6534 domain-containing protein n=1 Tax=Agaricus bisporus var. burnettii TaxID=192524 RepID=A0A8H7F1D8_AGABI|nr:hypothetical protein Agabi119p4_6148 [Agaricus bisporus var. burnettii]
MVDVKTTFGAILAGACLAFALSGAIALQCIVYFKTYPLDGARAKTLVSTVWLLDLLHSSLICVSIFTYFITYYGEPEKIDHIPWTIAFTVMVTAIQTYLVHCFFAQKIYKGSGRNWLITGPILVLTSGRLLAASVSTFEMIRLHQFSAFTEKYPSWVFTAGLSLSSSVDVLITGWLCYYLRTIRTRISPASTTMIRLVDSTTIYALENGALTCFTTTASLICWLAMPKNLVFLGLHFVIGKLYANSLLASLNIRRELEDLRWRAQNTTTRDRHRSELTGTSDLYPSTVSRERHSATSTKARSLRVPSEFCPYHSGRSGRTRLSQFQPSEPTIPERRVERLV